ncbi:hypothetical protein ACFFWD_17440 [Bradyrhizobium erythrophlei]|uniref:hypothetical protein n=1 Tax=Bradyrhizobium erythrophlei TaxID=1437360 RepID=UPI0035EF4483
MTAMIVPTERSDEGQVLCDRLNWHFLNAQRIRSDANTIGLDAARWDRLRAVVSDLPSRLQRDVRAGHFFFVGEQGDKETAAHFLDLIADARSVRAELRAILE